MAVDGELVDVLGIDTDPVADTVWYSRGYLTKQQGVFVPVYFPPLPKIYAAPNPSTIPFCDDFEINPVRGLGEEVELDGGTGDIWSKSGCGRQVYRLRPQASVP
jgi:hypothetical protein